jgi:hypothetical protein
MLGTSEPDLREVAREIMGLSPTGRAPGMPAIMTINRRNDLREITAKRPMSKRRDRKW